MPSTSSSRRTGPMQSEMPRYLERSARLVANLCWTCTDALQALENRFVHMVVANPANSL
jgi:hypothetical protein